MSGAAKITVAGAGVLGLTCALELARAGCEVTVCDPGPAMGGASGVAAGMLAPVFEAILDPVAAPHFDLLLAARDLWPSLADRAGLTLDRGGAMAVGEAAWIAELDAAMRRLGVHGEDLSITAASALAPGVSAEAALLTREDWRVEAVATIQGLRKAIVAAGGTFRAEAATGRGDADWLLVATGAARDLAPELAALTPVKGHIVRVRMEAPAIVLRGQGAYVAPVAGGVLVGATMEPGVADPAVDAAKAQPVLAAAARFMPALAAGPRDVFAGVRAATPDGLPLVGPSTEPGVLIAAGARRNGWLIAPLVARIIAAQAMGCDAGPWAAPLAARRFLPG